MPTDIPHIKLRPRLSDGITLEKPPFVNPISNAALINCCKTTPSGPAGQLFPPCHNQKDRSLHFPQDIAEEEQVQSRYYRGFRYGIHALKHL